MKSRVEQPVPRNAPPVADRRGCLVGKTALITGAARGIGKAIATGFVDAGAQVVVADRDLPAARRTCAELGGAVRAQFLDLADVDSCRACVRAVIQTAGQLHILVNNGGICKLKPLPDIDAAFYDETFAVNTRGAFFCSQAAARHMAEHRCGRMINIASIAAKTGGSADVSVYAASKAAMVAMTKAFARHLAPYGTANAILPGPTETELFFGWASERQATALRQQIPMRRLGTPADYVAAALFLAADGAAYITGATIDVNGGMLMD